MRGIDTNVLVRYLVKDDKRQAKKASEYIRKITSGGDRCFINHIVLCELVWVLDSAYGFDKKEIADILNKILITKQIEIDQKDIVRQAVWDYLQGKGDFADYLIGRINRECGCDLTATFDRQLQDSNMFEVFD